VSLLDPISPHRPAAHGATSASHRTSSGTLRNLNTGLKVQVMSVLSTWALSVKLSKSKLRQTGQSENCTLQKRTDKQPFYYNTWFRRKPVAHSRRCPCWQMGTVRHTGRSGTRPPVWNSPTRVPLVIVHLSAQHIAVVCLYYTAIDDPFCTECCATVPIPFSSLVSAVLRNTASLNIAQIIKPFSQIYYYVSRTSANYGNGMGPTWGRKRSQPV